ncbi:hypothetical protein J437_LFUL000451, partial [Ladona fulva]
MIFQLAFRRKHSVFWIILLKMACYTTNRPESDIEKLPKFVVMLLMGLPGSGKTTLCRTIPYVLGDKYHILHVCFDHFVQFCEEWSGEGSCGKWKSERAKLLLAVEELIKGFMFDKETVKNDGDTFATKNSESTTTDQQCLLESRSFQDVANESTFEQTLARNSNVSEKVVDGIHSLSRGDLDSRATSGAQVSAFNCSSRFNDEKLHEKYTLITDVSVQDLNFIYKYDLHDKIILLCVDDNFYYHSMRKEWWNLAARYELAFCTLVVSCELNTCIERVKKRESLYSQCKTVNVPIEVIKRMTKNLEIPNEKLYHWEKYWSVIDTTDLNFTFSETPGYCGKDHIFDVTSMQKFEKINKLLVNSLMDPVKPLTEGVNSECVIATPSIIHKVDLVLRKIVGKSDKRLKTIVNKRRKDILEDLKNGKIFIPKELTDEEVSDKEIL